MPSRLRIRSTKTGKKAELQDRVRMAGLSPRRCLDVLSNDDLYGILGSLPGVKVGGSKPQRLERIVDYFDRMVFRDFPAEASPGELYFRHLVELAARDREVLLANRVIRKDREMDAAFSVLMPESRVAPRPWMRPRGKARG